MFAKSKIAAIALTAGIIVSSNAQAVDVSLETYVTKLVNQAMTVAQQELQNSLTESVANATQKVNFNTSKVIKTKVTITDIKAKKVEVIKVASL